jgi:type II secretory pathway pseudopilin PulG
MMSTNLRAGRHWLCQCFTSRNRSALTKPAAARRSAFTLIELILAIALSITLLALIGAAINLYLLQVDASRTRIEETQLARSVLAMIADDLRATSIYKPQDTSGIASLVSASSKFDVDSMDKANPKSGGGSGNGGGSSSGNGGGSGGGNSSGQSSGSGSFSAGGSGMGSAGSSAAGMTAMGGASSAGGTAGVGTENDLTMPLGVNGTLEELYVDVERSPRLDEIFQTTTGYTNTQQLATSVGVNAASPPRPNTVRTVRYFIRQGRSPEAGSVDATSLAGERQMDVGGLVRQEIARPNRVFAEQAGDQAVLDSGQTLIAPEVAHIEFRYMDSTLGQIVDYWDMKEKKLLPPAIEVRIWILPAGADGTTTNASDTSSIMADGHEYRQIVYIPNSALCEATTGMTGGSGSGTSSSTMGTSSSTTGAASSGTGSSFDE